MSLSPCVAGLLACGERSMLGRSEFNEAADLTRAIEQVEVGTVSKRFENWRPRYEWIAAVFLKLRSVVLDDFLAVRGASDERPLVGAEESMEGCLDFWPRVVEKAIDMVI